MNYCRLFNLALALAALGFIGACRSAPPSAMSTHVGDEATLVGRMTPTRKAQTFTLQGVESTMLEFVVQAGDGAEAAPTVEILDPEGQRLPIAAAEGMEKGSATVRVTGLVLPKTGIYQVIATPTYGNREVLYSFRHKLTYLPPAPRMAHLSAEKPAPLYFSAPRGGFVAVTVTRARGETFTPDILAVKDPWGGPALDRSQVPAGANPPRVSRGGPNTMVLTFTAPKPGLYTVMAGAKPGASGSGTIAVQVRKPRGSRGFIYHGGAGSNAYGTPGGANAGAVAPAAAPAAAPPASRWGSPDGPVGIPPPPPPPSTASSVQPGTAPIDPPIAQR